MVLFSKGADSIVFLATVDPSPRPQPMKFPVFSQLAGNFGDSETGSLETASSSAESYANLSLRRLSAHARARSAPARCPPPSTAFLQCTQPLPRLPEPGGAIPSVLTSRHV